MNKRILLFILCQCTICEIIYVKLYLDVKIIKRSGKVIQNVTETRQCRIQLSLMTYPVSTSALKISWFSLQHCSIHVCTWQVRRKHFVPYTVIVNIRIFLFVLALFLFYYYLSMADKERVVYGRDTTDLQLHLIRLAKTYTIHSIVQDHDIGGQELLLKKFL